MFPPVNNLILFIWFKTSIVCTKYFETGDALAFSHKLKKYGSKKLAGANNLTQVGDVAVGGLLRLCTGSVLQASKHRPELHNTTPSDNLNLPRKPLIWECLMIVGGRSAASETLILTSSWPKGVTTAGMFMMKQWILLGKTSLGRAPYNTRVYW